MRARVLLPAMAALLTIAPAAAQVYRYVDENGVTVLTDVRPDPQRYPDARDVGCYGTCITGVDWHATPLIRDAFRAEVRAAARRHGVDAALVRAVMHAESWFETDAISHAGAMGLMQLMPATQRRFGVSDPFDPSENIAAGAAYLAQLLARYGDRELAVAAYNAGASAVDEHGGVPPFSETREYVRRVRILHARYRG